MTRDWTIYESPLGPLTLAGSHAGLARIDFPGRSAPLAEQLRAPGLFTDAVTRVRAVGAAVGRTPVPIIVPCHRVVGADGSLTGYGGGVQRKRRLLDLESAVSGGRPLPEVMAGRQLSMLA